MNDDSKCPTCGQSLVSDHAHARTRRNLKSQSRGTSRDDDRGLPREKGGHNPGGYEIGQRVEISSDLYSGHYRGPGTIVRTDILCVEFEFPLGIKRRVYIGEADFAKPTE